MGNNTPTQLTLGVQLRDEANFDNYFVTESNAATVSALSSLNSENHLTYLWGAENSGRTHLMQSLCHKHSLAGLGVLYLSLRERSEFDPGMLRGTNSLSMVCLDDVDAICGDEDWEQSLFTLYNDLQETDTQLLLSATCAPQQLPVKLADLHSRLQSGLVFQLTPLSDEEKCGMLSLRAANRGMELNQHVAEYIVKRADRNIDSLIAVLDTLDGETLQKGRRLTRPFVRDVMQW